MKNALFLGKFDPPHKGHLEIIRTLLRENKHVTVGIMIKPDRHVPAFKSRQIIMEELKNSEFYHLGHYIQFFEFLYFDEVIHGRDVGYQIREVKTSCPEISSTKIREGKRC